MSDVWYYAEGQKSVGPLSLADLTAILSRVSNAKDVLVWRDGFEQWQRAATVAELAAFVNRPPKPPPLPPSPPSLPPTLPSGPSIVPATAKDHKDRASVYRVGPDKRSRNIIVAIALGLMVVIGWQYFVGYPQMERQRQEAQLKQQQQQAQVQSGAPQAQAASREAVIRSSPRVAMDTPRLVSSINLEAAGSTI